MKAKENTKIHCKEKRAMMMMEKVFYLFKLLTNKKFL